MSIEKVDSVKPLPEIDFETPLAVSIQKEIEGLGELDDGEFIKVTRPVLRAAMHMIRGTEGDKISADNWVSHLLPDPQEPDRKNPLVVLPGPRCGYAEGCAGCTMCNYAGRGRAPTIEDADEALDFIFRTNEEHIAAHPESDHAVININAIASWFQDSEIHPEIREHVYRKVREYKNQHPGRRVIFVTEARFDDIRKEELERMRGMLGDDIPVEIGLGVESTNLLIREAIVNKGLPKQWQEKIALIKQYDMEVALHVMFGLPFLEEDQVIADAVQSTKDCITVGGDVVIFMVMNRKPGTLPDYLARHNRYTLPNVLALAEGLTRLGKELSPEDLKKMLVFGLIGPKEHAQAGTEYVAPHSETCSCNGVFDVLYQWRGRQEDLARLQEAVGQVSEDCFYKQSYHGPYEDVPELRDERARQLKRGVAETDYRLVTAIFPALRGKSFGEISQLFRLLDPIING